MKADNSIRLNLGCGGRPLHDYINVDMDILKQNRPRYLATTHYGNQTGAGQFHTSCYGEAKLHAICKKLNLKVLSIDHFQWKGYRDHMLGLTAISLDTDKR